MSTATIPTSEAIERFDCYGGHCLVLVAGTGPAGTATQAAARARRRMLEWHEQFSRFSDASELCALNRDPRERVTVTPTMARFVAAALHAAALTGGLVDPTLVTEVEAAGYDDDFTAPALSAQQAAAMTPLPQPAGPHPQARWRRVSVDIANGTVTRPAGVRLDSGGIAKGLFGDVLTAVLGGHDSFAVVAAGDIRFGGRAGTVRPVQVTDPVGGGLLHTFELRAGAAATSGVTQRRWIDAHGRLAHHLLDPATGRPAFTGVAQVTALAPTGVEAEARAKAALLAGGDGAAHWLPHGGVVVYDDGRHDVIEAGEALR